MAIWLQDTEEKMPFRPTIAAVGKLKALGQSAALARKLHS